MICRVHVSNVQGYGRLAEAKAQMMVKLRVFEAGGTLSYVPVKCTRTRTRHPHPHPHPRCLMAAHPTNFFVKIKHLYVFYFSFCHGLGKV